MNTVTLLNIYGPNRDTPDFYKKLREIINEYSSDFVILTGDFNLVLNPDMDCDNYRNVNNPNARNEVLSIINDFGLTDIWRVGHPDERRYTWFSNAPLKRSRLDFFLITEELSSLVVSTSISPGYRTDHSLIELSFKFDNQKRGHGFWKFNNSLLRECNSQIFFSLS